MDKPIIHSAEAVRCGGEALDQLWWQGRQWAVTSYGLEARNGSYAIEAKRLTELNPGDDLMWPRHLCERIGVDAEDFITAWLVALTLHGRRADPALVKRAVQIGLWEACERTNLEGFGAPAGDDVYLPI